MKIYTRNERRFSIALLGWVQAWFFKFLVSLVLILVLLEFTAFLIDSFYSPHPDSFSFFICWMGSCELPSVLGIWLMLSLHSFHSRVHFFLLLHIVSSLWSFLFTSESLRKKEKRICNDLCKIWLCGCAIVVLLQRWGDAQQDPWFPFCIVFFYNVLF